MTDLANFSEDALSAELRARQKRQTKARRRALERRAAKMPLFAEQIVERELAERHNYFAAIPTERDRHICALRVAERVAKLTGALVDIDDYVPLSNEDYGIGFSLCGLAYRAFAERVMHPLAVIGIACRLASLRARCYGLGPHYSASIWHSALVEAGYRRMAWEIHAAHSADPAKVMDFYRQTFEPRNVDIPEQIEIEFF